MNDYKTKLDAGFYDDIPLFDGIEVPEKSGGNIERKLDEILQRLSNIEFLLKNNTTSTSVNVSTSAPMVEGFNPALYPPKNAVPKSSMLGEIQSVLGAQDAVSGGAGGGPMPANEVSSICTMPAAAYDDNI